MNRKAMPHGSGDRNDDAPAESAVDRDDDAFAQQLTQWADRLADALPDSNDDATDSSQLSGRLARGLDTLRQLESLRRRRRQTQDDSRANGAGSCEMRDYGSHPTNPSDASHRVASQRHTPVPNRLGRFQILRELGRGGYGVVLLANDTRLDRLVALKVPRGDALSDATLRARFLQEARVAAGLNHPRIVPVFEAGEVGPICYIAYAYAPGLTLADWLRVERDPVKDHDAAKLIRSIAEGIQHAHERGVLHRDLKPANVILIPTRDSDSSTSLSGSETREPQHGERSVTTTSTVVEPARPLQEYSALITDFGLARALNQDSSMTRADAIVGTPSFMSPEQASGGAQQLSPAADVYSLGAMLYELLTGHAPFRGETPLETIQQVIHSDPISLRRLRSRIPRDLETICMKCLEKNAERRYASALELAEDLGRFIAGEPIHARPNGVVGRAWRWCRRNPAIASLSATVAMLVLCSTVAIGVSWITLRSTLTSLKESQVIERSERERAEASLYFRSVSLAHHQWKANYPDTARRLLQDTDPRRRGWEYDYVQYLIQAGRQEFASVAGDASSLSLSPNQEWIVTSHGKWGVHHPGRVIVRDARTGSVKHDWTVATGPVWRAVFSPDSTHVYAVTASWKSVSEPTVVGWDLTTGKTTFSLALGNAFAMDLSPDGQTLAVALVSGTIVLVDMGTGKELRRFLAHRDNVFGVSFTPDNQWLVTGSRDRTVRVWNVATGEPRGEGWSVGGDVRCLSVSPSGRYVAAGTYSGSIHVMRFEDGEKVCAYQGHRNPIRCARFTADDQRIISGSDDRMIRVWDVVSGRDVNQLRGHASRIVDVALTQNQYTVYSLSLHGTICQTDWMNPQEFEQPGPSSSSYRDFVVDATTQRISMLTAINVALGQSHVRLYRNTGHAFVTTFLDDGSEEIFDSRLTADGKSIVSISRGGSVALWDVATSERRVTWVVPNVTCLERHPVGSRIAIGAESGNVTLLDSQRPEFRKDIASGHSAVTSLCFSGSNQLGVGHREGEAFVRDARDGQLLWRLATDAQATSVTAIAIADHGTDVAVGHADGRLRMFHRTDDGTEYVAARWQQAAHSEAVRGLDFHPEGQRLVSGSMDGSVRIWDVDTGLEAIMLAGHANIVDVVRFSADGHDLISLSQQPLRWRTTHEGWQPPEAEQLVERHRADLVDCVREANRYATILHADAVLAAHPSDREALIARGEARAELAQWDLALADFRAVLTIDPLHRAASSGLAAILLWQHDNDAFDAHCQVMRDLTRNDSSVEWLNAVAWWHSLRPQTTVDPSWPLSLSERAMANLASSPIAMRDSRRHTLATAALRAGAPDRAIEILLEQLQASGHQPRHFEFATLAIAYHRLGHDEAAREQLAAAFARFDTVKGAASTTWRERVEGELMFRWAMQELGVARE